MFRATSLAAPRPTSGAAPRFPIAVVGALKTASGLGESARLCHAALQANGLTGQGVDIGSTLMQPEDYGGLQGGGRVPEGPGTLILHVNSPLVPLAMLHLGGPVTRGKYIVGCWAWELPVVPPDWRHGASFVHEIWVPSRFVAEAVAGIAGGRPVRVVPYPVALPSGQGRCATYAAHRPFTVLTIFNASSSFSRKNPCAAIQAFRRAFASDTASRLIVKTSNLSAFPKGIDLLKDAISGAANIVLMGDTMSAAEMDALYQESDVVMSLHRSEGFGLVLAEAMVRGLPVVATDWSGNVDFLTADTGYPVPYRLIPAEDPQGTYHHPNMLWAEADVAAAAAALRRLRDDRALGTTLGQSAARFASRAWSAEAYVGAVRQHLGL